MGLKEIETDVLVVGSGVAGVMAASKAARMGCKVVLASKVSMRSGNSALANGGWLIPSKDFSPDEYVKLVMEVGKMINEVKLVRILAQRGGAMIRALMEMKVPLERRGERYWWVKTGASKRGPGTLLMNGLLEHIRDERIIALPWCFITELLMDEGRVSGAVGVSREEGQVVIRAKSVVLATGGGGGIYSRHDNHKRIKGDGYWLALGVGLPLRDMEFVQCYPLGLAEPHLPPHYCSTTIPKRGKGHRLQGRRSHQETWPSVRFERIHREISGSIHLNPQQGNGEGKGLSGLYRCSGEEVEEASSESTREDIPRFS